MQDTRTTVPLTQTKIQKELEVPFTRVTVPAGMSAENKLAIAQGVHHAMVASIGIPEDDFFQLLDEYHPGDFFFDRRFLGIERGETPVVVHITMRRGRSDATKRELYAQISNNLGLNPGIRSQDIFIYLM